MPFKLAFKTFEQGKSIRCSACKSGENLIMVKPAHFAGASFGYYSAQGYLTIAAERDLTPASCRKYRCAVMFYHGCAR